MLIVLFYEPGENYPKPIVDHDSALKANLAKMKLAYQNGSNEGNVRCGKETRRNCW